MDFSSLLCESQGMVTINILYSLKPSKNTILEAGGGGLRSLPSPLLLSVYKPAAAHIYIFRNTGLYNEARLCQEQHFVLV